MHKCTHMPTIYEPSARTTSTATYIAFMTQLNGIYSFLLARYFYFVIFFFVVVVGFDCRRTYSNSPWTSSSIRFLYSIGNCRPPERYKRHKQTYHTYERTATRREWRRPLNMFSSNNNCVPLELHFFLFCSFARTGVIAARQMDKRHDCCPLS